jgi:predicted Zn-dependent protease
MKKTLSLLLLIALTAAASRSLRAYVTAKSLSAAGAIVPHKWDSSSFPITWQMNPVQGTNVTGSRTQAAVINQAFQAWQSVVPVSLQQGADTAPTVKADQYDRLNVITTNTTPTDLPPGVYAYTYTFYFDDGGQGVADPLGRPVLFAGQILEADMAFSSSYAFTTSTTVAPNQTDLQSIATHEAGHFLGMDHASNTSSTMFWNTVSGYSYQRNLSTDDIAGISTLYPPASFASQGTLNGTVRTTSNAPVYGAIVVAVNANGVPVASTVTDPSGAYSIQGLAPGSYTVYAEPLSGRIGPANIGTLFAVYPNSTANTNFTTRYH